MDRQDIISKYPPKQIMLLPIAIVALALIILGATYLSTGYPVHLGIEFTGGTVVVVPATESQEAVASQFAGYPLVDIREAGADRYMLQFGPMSESEYKNLVEQVNSDYGNNAQITNVGPIYSRELQAQSIKFLPLSFLLMAIVVFVVFREPMVSLLVVLSALADILIAAASMNITGVQLSLGTMAALLMLIGYSVDTNIFLSMRVLKRKGTTDEKIIGAMGTGLMMTGTSIAAVLALLLVSNIFHLVIPSFSKMPIVADISAVLLFGLLADIFNTWITNAQGLRWYMARPKKSTARRQRK